MFIELHNKKVDTHPAFVINTDYIIVIDANSSDTASLTVRLGQQWETIHTVESYKEVISLISGI